MTKKFDIVVFPGDYGGPEVMAEGLKVLNALSAAGDKILLMKAALTDICQVLSEIERQYHLDVSFNLKYHLIGGVSLPMWEPFASPLRFASHLTLVVTNVR